MSGQYEEAEGITVAMVRAYLERNYAWFVLESDKASTTYCRTNNTDAPRLHVFHDGSYLGQCIESLAIFERRSTQSLLRDINQRMRKGIPSAADIEAHRSRPGSQPWLARDEHGNQRVGWWTKPHWAQQPADPYTLYVQGRGHLPVERVKDWSFWPADRDLNKIPWPARSGEGE